MDEKKKLFLRRAIELARENVDNGTGGPFGAVVVRKDVIVSEGSNRVVGNNDPTAHAEITAIREAGKRLRTFDLSDCEIFTSCEPCPMCLGAIYWSRIKKIYFAASKTDAAKAGFDDDFIYREFSLPVEKRELPVEQMLKMEAVKVLKRWDDSENKKPY